MKPILYFFTQLQHTNVSQIKLNWWNKAWWMLCFKSIKKWWVEYSWNRNWHCYNIHKKY